MCIANDAKRRWWQELRCRQRQAEAAVLMFWLIVALVALGLNVVLQGLDVWSTLVSLQDGAREQNPFSRAIMDRFGVGAWVAIKALLVAVIWWVGFYTVGIRDDKASLKRVAYSAIAVAVWMAFVIHNNLEVMGIL